MIVTGVLPYWTHTMATGVIKSILPMPNSNTRTWGHAQGLVFTSRRCTPRKRSRPSISLTVSMPSYSSSCRRTCKMYQPTVFWNSSGGELTAASGTPQMHTTGNYHCSRFPKLDNLASMTLCGPSWIKTFNRFSMSLTVSCFDGPCWENEGCLLTLRSRRGLLRQSEP